MLCASTKTATEHRPKAASNAIIGEKVLTSTDSMQVTTSTRKLTAKVRSAPTPPQQKNSSKAQAAPHDKRAGAGCGKPPHHIIREAIIGNILPVGIKKHL